MRPRARGRDRIVWGREEGSGGGQEEISPYMPTVGAAAAVTPEMHTEKSPEESSAAPQTRAERTRVRKTNRVGTPPHPATAVTLWAGYVYWAAARLRSYLNFVGYFVPVCILTDLQLHTEREIKVAKSGFVLRKTLQRFLISLFSLSTD
jgi:hypothetical protein